MRTITYLCRHKPLKPTTYEFFFGVKSSDSSQSFTHLELAVHADLKGYGPPDVAPHECLNLVHADDTAKLLWITMSSETVQKFASDAAAVDALGVSLAAYFPALGSYSVVGFNQVGVGGLTSSTTTTTTTTSTTTTTTTTTQTTSTLTT